MVSSAFAAIFVAIIVVAAFLVGPFAIANRLSWDTEAGRGWLPRLVVATRSTVGRKRGVGVDTSSAFCSRLQRYPPGGGSPPA